MYIDGTLLSTEKSYGYGPGGNVASEMYVGKPNNANHAYGSFAIGEWYLWDDVLDLDEVKVIYEQHQ